MEKLQISPRKKQTAVWHAGNEVLRIFSPVVTGETTAAKHTAALMEALLAYAQKSAGETAAAALSAAAEQGRLFDFARHTYDISLQAEPAPTYTKITISVKFTAGEALLFSHTLTMYWDRSETVQLKKAPRQCTQKHKKSREATNII